MSKNRRAPRSQSGLRPAPANTAYVSEVSLPDFSLWDKMKVGGMAFSFDLEVTARCNNHCRHCYINLPAQDKKAKKNELSLVAIKKIIDEAASLGALWCLLTGGEPLLREDFPEIYLYLKKKGFLISVFTNATLINAEHIALFQKAPPRDMEVTVYGVTRETYERVSRVPGSFDAFMRGVGLLLKSGIKVRFKAMALRSNVHELPQIAAFCRARTKDYFRFDPALNLRFDGNSVRNKEIRSERLSADEVVAIEKNDPERFDAVQKACKKIIPKDVRHDPGHHLFHCGAGQGSFTVGHDGFFRLCSSLWHPECIYDLRKGSLAEAYRQFVPRVRGFCSDDEGFSKKCHNCPLIDLCTWCPAHAYLETKRMDKIVDCFCEAAHKRVAAFRNEAAR